MTQNRKETRSRPGWRGPGQSKPSKASQPPKTGKISENKTAGPADESVIPAVLQQQLLNVFKNAFPSLTEGGADNLKPLLQEVKQALFERDFERAFGREDYLEAYAFRWSPSRALCYVSILVDLQEYFSDTELLRSVLQPTAHAKGSARIGDEGADIVDASVHVVSLGGGAAEIAALGGYIKYLLGNKKSYPQETLQDFITEPLSKISISNPPPPTPNVNLLLVDTAAWASVIQKLHSSLNTPPPLSKYASFAAKASNPAFLPKDILNPTFHQANLLDLAPGELRTLLGPSPTIITLLFTLNELYSASIPRTTSFLRHLSTATSAGTLLLVVDSPGSYSEAVLGKESKRYPMQWLMDHTLLGTGQVKRAGGEKGKGGGEGGEEEEPRWEKVLGDESRWFRLPEGLRYAISLENMRYQVHLFRRL